MERILLQQSSFSQAQTERIGEEFAKSLQKGDFVRLSGELGAGKTAFVRGMCRHLCPDARVQSPTYTVMRVYEHGEQRFYHFDFYRITSEEDLESVGFYDCDGIIAAEWCENALFALPDAYYCVSLMKTDRKNERRITIARVG